LLPKLDQVELLLQSTNAAALAVSETWLDDSVTDEEVTVPGYSVVRKDRNREGGGVCLYIRDNICFNKRDDLITNNIEFLAVDILLPKTKPFLLSVGYRPPEDYHYFSKLEELFLESNFTQSESYMLGDFNVNVLKSNHSICL
jgi:hypothetical protein